MIAIISTQNSFYEIECNVVDIPRKESNSTIVIIDGKKYIFNDDEKFTIGVYSDY